MNPGMLPSGGRLELDVLTLALHGSTVMNPGIVAIRRKFGKLYANTRTTWNKLGICWDLPPHK
jgi:hypothetical protein